MTMMVRRAPRQKSKGFIDGDHYRVRVEEDAEAQLEQSISMPLLEGRDVLLLERVLDDVVGQFQHSIEEAGWVP